MKHEKHKPPTREHHRKHVCPRCQGTEICVNCQGRGCIDCDYTGECPACQSHKIIKGKVFGR